MTDSTSSFMAIAFGLAVFAVIVAVGWRSVQNRRILRLQAANGQETIVVANDGDQITSVATAAEPAPAAPSDPSAEVTNDRLNRVVSAAK